MFFVNFRIRRHDIDIMQALTIRRFLLEDCTDYKAWMWRHRGKVLYSGNASNFAYAFCIIKNTPQPARNIAS